jgi:excisionase family DNA binding protein
MSEGLEVKEAKLVDKAYFSVKEFKDRLGVSSNLIYEQLRKGALPSVRLGGRILIPVDALQQMMERQGQRETPTERE